MLWEDDVIAYKMYGVFVVKRVKRTRRRGKQTSKVTDDGDRQKSQLADICTVWQEGREIKGEARAGENVGLRGS